MTGRLFLRLNAIPIFASLKVHHISCRRLLMTQGRALLVHLLFLLLYVDLRKWLSGLKRNSAAVDVKIGAELGRVKIRTAGCPVVGFTG